MIHAKIQGLKIRTADVSETKTTGATTNVTATVIKVGQLRCSAAVITIQCALQRRTIEGRSRGPEWMLIKCAAVAPANDLTTETEAEIATQEPEEAKTVARTRLILESKTQALIEEDLVKSRPLQIQIGFPSCFRDRKASVQISKCVKYG